MIFEKKVLLRISQHVIDVVGEKIFYSSGNKSCFIKQLADSTGKFPMVSSIYGKTSVLICAWEHRNSRTFDVGGVVEINLTHCKIFYKKMVQGIRNY